MVHKLTRGKPPGYFEVLQQFEEKIKGKHPSLMKIPEHDWMERVIRFNTIAGQSNEELVAFLSPLLKNCGLHVIEQRLNNNGVPLVNLVGFSHTPTSEDLLVLSSCLDTADSGNPGQWTKTNGDPFQATCIRDRIYGLGSADQKLDFLCKLTAAWKLQRSWVRPFAIVGTFGREKEYFGTRELLKAKKIVPRFALVGCPSNLELIYSHKGHINLIVFLSCETEQKESSQQFAKRWKQKKISGLVSDSGINPIIMGLMDIMKRGYGIISIKGGIDRFSFPDTCEATLVSHQNLKTKKLFSLLRVIDEFSLDLKKHRDSRFSPPAGTLSLNRIQTGNNGFELAFDIRCLPDVDLDRLQKKLETALNTDDWQIVDQCSNKALKGKKNGKLIQTASEILKSLGIQPSKKTKTIPTEASHYALSGAETLVFGPGSINKNQFQPNEFNSLKQLQIATLFYYRFLCTPAAALS